MVLSKSPSETDSSVGESGAMPALLTRMSSRPRSAYNRSTAGSMLSHSPDMQGQRHGRDPGRLR